MKQTKNKIEVDETLKLWTKVQNALYDFRNSLYKLDLRDRRNPRDWREFKERIDRDKKLFDDEMDFLTAQAEGKPLLDTTEEQLEETKPPQEVVKIAKGECLVDHVGQPCYRFGEGNQAARSVPVEEDKGVKDPWFEDFKKAHREKCSYCQTNIPSPEPAKSKRRYIVVWDGGTVRDEVYDSPEAVLKSLDGYSPDYQVFELGTEYKLSLTPKGES